ncbi:hypothetical protein GCM10028812_16290 [Ancylobacter sonchi]
MGSALDKPVAQMGANKARPAGDQNPTVPAQGGIAGDTGMRHRSLHGCRTFDLAVMMNVELRDKMSDISYLAASTNDGPVPSDQGMPGYASSLEKRDDRSHPGGTDTPRSG